jgi:DNA modification methylase
MRYSAAKALKLKEVPTYLIEGLTEAKEREIVIRDNISNGEFDFDILANEWSDLPLLDWGLDLPADWLKAEETVGDAPAQLDRAEELNKKWQVKYGDLFQVGFHKLLCGDSTKKEDVERVMGGEKADMVFTDPPYGISVVKNRHIGGGGPVGGKKNYKGTIVGNNIVKANQYNPIQGDDKPFDPMFLLELSENLIIFGGNYFANKLPNSRGWLVWDKLDGMDGTTKNFSDFEMAWTSFDKPARLFRHRWQGLMKGSERDEKRCHPTQKPVQVCIDILEYYGNGENIIIDPFLGSGTTMVACQNLNRKCRGIEISPQYVAVCLERMKEAFPGIEIRRIE